MQINSKKAKRLKEIDDRNGSPSDTFNSIVSEDQICDEGPSAFIRKLSKMTE